MIRRRLITIIMALAAVIAASAAITSDEALAKTAAKINSAKALTATFKATASDGVAAYGQLTIAKEKFAMISTDFGVWYNGEDMWSYYKGNGETSLTQPTPDELLETNPFDIVNHYKQQYTSKLLSDKGGKCVVELTPKSRKSSVARATLTIDTATWLPTAITATFANSTSIVIDIQQMTEADTVPAKSTFEFPAAKYPGVEIVDLR